ncbi:MAG TPA: MarR family transcriptional regulator [Acidimicrobiia bacterium]|jgi:DNA-binding MarR family transcriptional regulator
MDLDEAAVARLRLSITRLARRIRQQAGASRALSPSRLSALTTIDRRGPLRLGDLAARERISKPSITRIVARLERAGLAERTPDPDDRRSVRIAITPQGRRTLVTAGDRADRYLAEHVAALGDEDRATLAAALPALERLLEIRP